MSKLIPGQRVICKHHSYMDKECTYRGEYTLCGETYQAIEFDKEIGTTTTCNGLVLKGRGDGIPYNHDDGTSFLVPIAAASKPRKGYQEECYWCRTRNRPCLTHPE